MSDPIAEILELARRVRTQEGAKTYGKPVGSLIDSSSPGGSSGSRTGGPPAKSSMPKDAPGRTTGGPTKVSAQKASTREVTIERLRSLQQQVRAAARTDDAEGIKEAEKAFNEALSEFSKTRDPKQVRSLLSAGKKK